MADGGSATTGADALFYPFGGEAPEPGTLFPIAPGVHWWRLAIPGPLRHVNGYVLDDGDGVVLVDTGVNSDAGVAAWEALIAGPLAGRRVTRVLCTHMHPDHIGVAGWLCRRFDAPLVMTRTEWLWARMLTSDRRDETPTEMLDFWRAAGWDAEEIDHARAAGWSRFARSVARLPLGYRRMEDGDTLAIGDTHWRVVVGSGHSPEHACLLDEARGILIAGDQVLPRISSNVSLGVSEPDADPLGEWLDSIARFRRLPADLLVLPGHGDPFRGLHPRLDALAAEHRGRLDMLHAFLSEPRRAVDCFGQLFRRPVGRDVIGIATGEALAHLRRLEVEGRATRATVDGVWWYSAA